MGRCSALHRHWVVTGATRSALPARGPARGSAPRRGPHHPAAAARAPYRGSRAPPRRRRGGRGYGNIPPALGRAAPANGRRVAGIRGVPVTEEREIKIPVVTDFVLPDLDGVVEGTHAVDRGTVELSATYWDTDGLTLLHANLGLRHRSAPGEPGKWTLKAGNRMVGQAVSREETDFSGPPRPAATSGPRCDPHGGWRGRAPSRRSARDRPAHRRSCDRRHAPRRGGRRPRLSTLRRPDGRTFREVEVELFDADDALIDAVMARLRRAGVGEPESTPKYVRALRALGHDVSRRTRGIPPSRCFQSV